jgi:hypothetical protein
MATYMTRIELHDAMYRDYEVLHSAMAAEGFSRTIVGDNGIVYQLPTAEYYRSTQLSLEQVLDSAKRAASKTGKNYGAISTVANGSMWIGLPQG